MHLEPSQRDRFYGVWWSLLGYVNERLDAVPGWEAPSPGQRPPTGAIQVRDALWKSPHLLVEFVERNPAGLAAPDLQLAASWERRVQDSFVILQQRKRYAVFLGGGHAYGVLGLTDPIADIAPMRLPVFAEAVLLPYDDRIIYDGVLKAFALLIGPGMRRGFLEEFQEIQQTEGIVTSLARPAAHAAPMP